MRLLVFLGVLLACAGTTAPQAQPCLPLPPAYDAQKCLSPWFACSRYEPPVATPECPLPTDLSFCNCPYPGN
jgi:hypothetical protein